MYKQDLVLNKQQCLIRHQTKLILLIISVKGDPKAPFSIATTLRYRGGCHSISWIAPLFP